MPKYTVEVDFDLDDFLNDPDHVRNEVKATIVAQLARECRIDWIIDEPARRAMREAVATEITTIVREVVGAEVEKIATSEFTPTNRWGEKAGAPITLREMIATQAQAWFSVEVDASGKPDSYGSNKATRAAWLVRQTVEAVFSAEMKTFTEQLKEQVRTSLAGKVRNEIAATVAKLLQP